MKNEKITLNKLLKTFNLSKDDLQWIYENWEKLELINQIFTSHYHCDYDVNDDAFVWFINPKNYEDYYVFDRQNEDFFVIIAPIIKDYFQLYTYNQLSNTKWFNNYTNIELFSWYDSFKYFIPCMKEPNIQIKDINEKIKFEYDWKDDRVYYKNELENNLEKIK